MLCDRYREKVEDFLHFLVLCEECEWEGQELLKRIGDIYGLDVWLEELTWEDNVRKMAVMLGRRVVCSDRMVAEIESVVMAE